MFCALWLSSYRCFPLANMTTAVALIIPATITTTTISMMLRPASLSRGRTLIFPITFFNQNSEPNQCKVGAAEYPGDKINSGETRRLRIAARAVDQKTTYFASWYHWRNRRRARFFRVVGGVYPDGYRPFKVTFEA